VFTSDNGPHHESYIAGQDYAPTSFQSYGPFDGAKSDIWEGGIRVPTLAWWPETIPAGYVNSHLSQFHDWLSTFVELAGLPRPAICDGINLMPHLTGHGTPESSTVYVEYLSPGKTPAYSDFEARKRGLVRKQMQAVFMDGYKGVRIDIQSHDDDFEIYDLSSDPGERNDLAHSSPAFALLNQRMKDRALQLHKASAEAVRPYDYLMIPAVPAPKKLDIGLHWKMQEGGCPWVAQLTRG
jgi:arylsulfatase A-like enzyme